MKQALFPTKKCNAFAKLKDSGTEKSARDRVFIDIVEIHEMILLQLPPKDLLLIQRVSRHSKAVIGDSPSVQRALFFRTEVISRYDRHASGLVPNPFFASKYFPNVALLVVNDMARGRITYLRSVPTERQSDAKDKQGLNCYRAVLSLRTTNINKLRNGTLRPIKRLHLNGLWQKMPLTQPPLGTCVMLDARLAVRVSAEYTATHIYAMSFAAQAADRSFKLGKMLPSSGRVTFVRSVSSSIKRCCMLGQRPEGPWRNRF